MEGVGNSNYLSEGALMAWVAEQQNRLYGDLQQSMGFAELRADMAADASDLKLLLQNASKDPAALPALGDALAAFTAKYGAVPEFSEMNESVVGIANAVSDRVTQQREYESYVAEHGGVEPSTQAANYAHTGNAGGNFSQTNAAVGAGGSGWQAVVAPKAASALDAETVKGWADNLGGKVDASNQNEQLGMIRIGEIKANIDQSSSLASQLVKSSNDSTASIIHNMA